MTIRNACIVAAALCTGTAFAQTLSGLQLEPALAAAATGAGPVCPEG